MKHFLVAILSQSASGTSSLETPVISATQAGAGDPVIIDWADILYATSYQVQRATNSGFTTGLSTLGTPSSSTFTDTDVLVDGTTYYYRVKAIGAGYTDSAYGSDSIEYVSSGEPIVPFNLATATPITVDATGTIGVDCDFNTIWDAISSVTDNSVSNQYKILVQPGTYPETGYFNPDISLYQGIIPKAYVHIIGMGTIPEDVLITGPETGTPANETSIDVFHIPVTYLIQNVHVRAHNLKYCFHVDYSLANFDMYIKDCKLEHLGSALGYIHAIGCGFYHNQRLTVINCTMPTGQGFYAHGNQSTVRDLSEHFEIELFNCTMPQFLWLDCIEYAGSKITLTNNVIDTVNLQTYTGIYDANSGNPTCNTGTKVYTTFFNSGNSVDALVRDSETAAILDTVMDDVTDFN